MHGKSFIIWWNNTFPLDKWYREKYKLGFNSEAHRDTNLIDIYFEWVEDQLFADYEQNREEEKERAEEVKKGKWLKERKLTEAQQLDLFSKIDIKKFNKKSSNIKIE